MQVAVVCAWCGKESFKEGGAVNRAKRISARLFCDRKCAGMHRRKGKSAAQKKEEKRLYDEEYRKKNLLLLKDKKAKYHKDNYDKAKAAVHRKKRMPYHVEYCRGEDYRRYKRKYDAVYRAKRYCGEFWEVYLLTADLQKEILSRMNHEEIAAANGTQNKSINRRREYERFSADF